MSPLHVGWGAGTADLADRPNVLRVVLGEPAGADDHRGRDAHDLHHTGYVVLESNIDDATGEIIAVCIESLLAQGALDAWATPAVMKKGRPAWVVSAIAPEARADAIAHVFFRETSTLGVRRASVSRYERARRIIEVTTPYGTIPVKVADGPFAPTHRKPEFQACLEAARAFGVPVRVVIDSAMVASADNDANASALSGDQNEARVIA